MPMFEWCIYILANGGGLVNVARDVNAGEHDGKNDFLWVFFTLNVGQNFMYYILCALGSSYLHP